MPTPKQWVKKQRLSGLSQRKFALTHGIPGSTFHRWAQKFTQESKQNSQQAPQFMEVVSPPCPQNEATIRLYFDERPLSIDIEPNTDLVRLCAIVSALC